MATAMLSSQLQYQLRYHGAVPSGSAANFIIGENARPLLRGRLHQVCALASVPAGAHLIGAAGSTQRPAAMAYALTWSAMFATSACYHRLAQSPTARRRMRRADHSMIFVHIGGTATALALSCLPALLTMVVLAGVWSGVIGGVAVKTLRLVEGASAGSWLYGLVGATQVLTLPALIPQLSPGQLLLLLFSGFAYGVGAVLFFRKRPDPYPTVFGYHEVWHCFTLVGGLAQYLLLLQLLAG